MLVVPSDSANTSAPSGGVCSVPEARAPRDARRVWTEVPLAGLRRRQVVHRAICKALHGEECDGDGEKQCEDQ